MKKNIKNKFEETSIKDYTSVLVQIKRQIEEAQVRAISAVNTELIKLYWAIGKIIFEKQQINAWGSSIIEKLARDLQNLFPKMAGFSKRNVFRIQAFYAAYQKSATMVAQITNLPMFRISWGHNSVILEKIKNDEKRLWYAQKTIEYGWSRRALEAWIKSDLYEREGKAITNFTQTLPDHHSKLAQESFKDPYIFDFLTLHDEHIEKDLENGLINNVEKLLLEMGKGFALVARQFHLEVGNKDYYIDLLFYHITLKCFIVVELKAREFEPKDAGQINFYLSAVDDLVKNPDDKPTLGLLLCKTKDNFTAEYALRDINKPIGIAEYQTEIISRLPKELKSSLPSIEEIEAELEKQETLSKH